MNPLPDLPLRPTAAAPLLLTLPVPAAIWRVAGPVLGLGLLRTAYFLADSFWAGHLGTDAAAALAGLGAASFAFWILGTLGDLPAVGTHALVAFAVGARQPERVAALTTQGLGLALLLSVGLALGRAPLLQGYFALFGFGEPGFEAPLAQGTAFLDALLLGSLPLLLHGVTDAAFRGMGDTRTPMAIAALTLGVNIVLDPFLMFGWAGGPSLGLRGAAWATVVSHALAVLLSLWALSARGHRPTWPGPHQWALGRIAAIGAPQSASGTGFCLVYVALGQVLNRFGPAAVAGLGVGHRLESAAYMVCVAFAAGASTLVGQNLGAGDRIGAERAARSAARTCVLWMVPFASLFVLFPGALLAVFTSDPATALAGSWYLRCAGLAAVFMALEIVYEGAFAGAGLTLPALALALPLTALRIPLAWALAVYTPLGALGIFAAVALSTLLKGVSLRWAFLKRFGTGGHTGAPG